MNGWCSTCRRRSVVEEVTTEAQLTRRGEVEHQVAWLACGHTQQGEGVRTGPAAGYPYAGSEPA